MEILRSGYTLTTENYNRKTPDKLKLVADALLLLVPVLTTAQVTCPEFPGKEWVFWGIITLFSIFKIVSKFVADSASIDIASVDLPTDNSSDGEINQ